MPKISPRFVWISLAVIALGLAAAFLVISSRVHAFLRSDDFRKLVSEKTGDAFHAEAQYAPLRWAGPSVFSDSLRATGNPGSIISNIQADQIRAEVNWRAIFGGAWRVESVEVLNFDAMFQPGSPAAGKDAGDPPVAANGLASFLPSRFELGKLNISKARLAFLGPDGRPGISLIDSAITVRPNGAGWAIDGNGGSLTLPDLPPMTATSFRTRIQGKTFFLTDASLRVGDTGKVSGSGEFAENSKLRLQWNGIDIAPFLPTEWKARLSGIMAGTADIAWPVTGMADATATGTFRVTEGLIQNVGTLEEVAKFTGAPQFRRMPVQEFSGNYKWSKGNVTLTNLVLESKGLLRVEGTCDIAANGALAGTLRVGVTPQTLQWLPGSRERVFTVAQSGYLWTNIRIGGTVKNIQEDLSPRLANAMKDEVIHQGVRTIENLPGPAKDGVKDVLDILTPLIR